MLRSASPSGARVTSERRYDAMGDTKDFWEYDPVANTGTEGRLHGERHDIVLLALRSGQGLHRDGRGE